MWGLWICSRNAGGSPGQRRRCWRLCAMIWRLVFRSGMSGARSICWQLPVRRHRRQRSGYRRFGRHSQSWRSCVMICRWGYPAISVMEGWESGAPAGRKGPVNSNTNRRTKKEIKKTVTKMCILHLPYLHIPQDTILHIQEIHLLPKHLRHIQSRELFSTLRNSSDNP